MKTFIGISALLAALALPALAFTPGGISGTVQDASGRPAPNVSVAFFRLPLHNVDSAVATVSTDRSGFFSKLVLQPGRYMVTVATGRNLSACAVHDIFDNAVTHVKMTLHDTADCKGARLHAALVNPSIGSSYYLIH
ncbi:MAG TPA: carboxypeptidase-like regulatory domain-containing protein [Alphaproteobacteria bacterium]|nr:carboxypeptidase-like regulatory domain-containing protein [Alphaproteobacteria bacterium]